MNHFRESPLNQVAAYKVIKSEDYLRQIRRVGQNEEAIVGFDQADVIKLFLEDGSWIAIRPSGTEPKCKFYYCIVGEDEQDVQNKFVDFDQFIQNEIKKV